MTNPLVKYSTAVLLEEIARREQARTERKPVEHWCEDCARFKFWTKDGDPPNDYNPCSMEHKMSFRVPDDYMDVCGYYRRICKDRQPVTESEQRT
jgi:hypothetical protein